MTSIRIIKPQLHDLGAGLQVRRLLPHRDARSVGPFVFFDHFGPLQLPPGGESDVRPHPHIGLATLSYLFSGALLHRDSLGNEQLIVPGDVNWMTAGRGIVHSERSPPQARADGQRLHGLQCWVALPADQEDCAPAFAHICATDLPRWQAPGATARILVGSALGMQSPIRTSSPTLYVALDLASDVTLGVPNEYAERAIYIVSGVVQVDGVRVEQGCMAILDAGSEPELTVLESSQVMLLGGAPLDGPRHLWWNFVSSSRQRIEQAKLDWLDQRIGTIPGETEFIPLPLR